MEVTDLELLTGMLVNNKQSSGLLLYKLIEHSDYKKDLVDYASFSSDEDLKSKLRGLVHVNTKESKDNSSTVSDIRYSFEKWITSHRR